jgi:hypothetical protein
MNAVRHLWKLQRNYLQVTIQQTITRVCRRTSNYFVGFLCTIVPSFLLQGLDRQQEARFAGDAIFKIKVLLFSDILLRSTDKGNKNCTDIYPIA